MSKNENSANGKNDLKINGTGTTNGGSFNDVIINGVGSIKGDIECISFKSNGTSSMTGNLKSSSLKVNGTTAIAGNVNSEEIKINGTADFSGTVEGVHTKVHGAMNVTGNISSDEIELNGGMRISGDCSAEAFRSKGGFTVNGLLNAGNIDIKLHGPCKAKEIGGETIIVKQGNEFAIKKIIKSLFPSWEMSRRLSAEVIEGNEIDIEFTKAKVVRGNNVKIGEGCEIDLVEYKNSYLNSDKSEIKENKKV